jgi:gluconolactonase
MRCVAAGIGFTEGPLWTTDGRLVVTSMSRGLLYAVDPESGAVTVAAEPGGNPTGLAQDEEGVVWIAQGGGHAPSRSQRHTRPSIQRWHDGRIDDVVANGLDAPNDCVIGPDGRLWFTDPRGAALDPEGPPGRVCALERADGRVAVVADGIGYPNGLAFTADGSALHVAETRTARILRLAVTADGGLSASEIFAELAHGLPDGLALDAAGRLHVAATTADAVVVLDAEGRIVEELPVGKGALPTNVCFGGADHRTLFVTAGRGGRVLALPREVSGPLLTHVLKRTTLPPRQHGR